MADEKCFESFVPNPKQQLFIKSDAPNKLAFGGARAGKSAAVAIDTHKDMLLNPGLFVLGTRTVFQDLFTTNYRDFIEWAPKGAIDQKRRRKTSTTVEEWYKNGSHMLFKAFEEHDIIKARGYEFGRINMYEANLFTRNAYEYLQTRLSQKTGKGVGPDMKVRDYRIPFRKMVLDTNPRGRDWIWKIFRREHPGAYEGTDPDFFAVHFKTIDNLMNLAPDFMERQRATLSKMMFEKFINGDESPNEGLVFPMFDRRIHVLNVRGFVPPPHWPVYLGIDYGFATHTHVVWLTISEEGHIIVFHEYFVAGQTVRGIAEAVNTQTEEMARRGVPRPTLAVIDPSTAQERAGEAKTIFQMFVEAGLRNLMPGKREDRFGSGVSILQQMLEPHVAIKHPIYNTNSPTGYPQLYFTEDVPQATKEFDEWSYPQVKDEFTDRKEKPEEGHDHGIDAVRYPITSGLTAAGMEPMTKRLYESSPAFYMKKLIEKDLKAYRESQKGRAGWSGRVGVKP